MGYEILQWLSDQGYEPRMSDDMFNFDKFILKISKDGYSLEASLPKDYVAAPEELRKKIENMKAVMDMLTDEDQEET